MNKFWNPLNVIAAGLIVLVMVSLLLFLGRFICYQNLWQSMPRHSKTVEIYPSGIVPGEGTPGQQNPNINVLRDPNTRLSSIQANIDESLLGFEAVGAAHIFMNVFTFHYRVENGIYFWFVDKNNFLFFNESTGLFERKIESTIKTPGGEKVTEVSDLFAGPNGISSKESPSLGRFENPIISDVCGRRKLIIYDINKSRFFSADFNDNKVSEGLELKKGDTREPIAMGWIEKSSYELKFEWHHPEIKDANGNWISRDLYNDEPNKGINYRAFCDPFLRYITFLAQNGLIYNLDTDKWTIREAGFLPTPASLFSESHPKKIALSEDLLAYQVMPIYSYLRVPKQDPKSWYAKDVNYLGMFVAALSREGTALTIAVFDPNGRLVNRQNTGGQEISSAEEIYNWGGMSIWTAGEYVLENLQPPVLEAVSYFCANCFEAGQGYRAIFILPNSFVGMLGRGTSKDIFEQIIKYFALTALSLILSVLLAIEIFRDAILIGLSPVAKKWWVIGTIAFGLPAYITYQLTKPKETLVTCPNCGKMRRPDMETCHRCGSKWEIPELMPPNWRICD